MSGAGAALRAWTSRRSRRRPTTSRAGRAPRRCSIWTTPSNACLVAFERIAEFRGEGTFQSWVKRIAARLYVKRWRKLGRLELTADPSDSETRSSHEHDANARIDLDEALRALPNAERVCVSLCYGAGFSHAEAAEALNTPLGTVKSHVKRGLDRLRERLAASPAQAGRRVHG